MLDVMVIAGLVLVVLWVFAPNWDRKDQLFSGKLLVNVYQQPNGEWLGQILVGGVIWERRDYNTRSRALRDTMATAKRIANAGGFIVEIQP